MDDISPDDLKDFDNMDHYDLNTPISVKEGRMDRISEAKVDRISEADMNALSAMKNNERLGE